MVKKKPSKLKAKIKKGKKGNYKELEVSFEEIKDKLTNRKVNMDIMDVMQVLMNIAKLADSVENKTKKETKNILAQIGTNVAELMNEEMSNVLQEHLLEQTNEQPTSKDINYIG